MPCVSAMYLFCWLGFALSRALPGSAGCCAPGLLTAALVATAAVGVHTAVERCVDIVPASPHEEDSIVSASPHEEDEHDSVVLFQIRWQPGELSKL